MRHCPSCTCAWDTPTDATPVEIDSAAPFWPLVALLDEILDDERRAKLRAAGRRGAAARQRAVAS
jgi:hypothetical protein